MGHAFLWWPYCLENFENHRDRPIEDDIKIPNFKDLPELSPEQLSLQLFPEGCQVQLQEKPTNVGTQAAEVLHNFLAGKR